MSKSIMLSIQPYYVFLIIARLMGWDIPQHKTVEVRKDCPKDSAWNRRVHIYCSKSRKSFNRIPKQYQPLMEKFLGKVIGEFACLRLEKFTVGTLRCDDIEELSCLSYSEMIDYFYKPEELDGKTAKEGYGWHIDNLKVYDTPKELGEFFVEGDCEGNDCLHCKNFHEGEGWLDESYCDESDCIHWGIKPLTRPPQSWQYIEELD